MIRSPNYLFKIFLVSREKKIFSTFFDVFRCDFWSKLLIPLFLFFDFAPRQKGRRVFVGSISSTRGCSQAQGWRWRQFVYKCAAKNSSHHNLQKKCLAPAAAICITTWQRAKKSDHRPKKNQRVLQEVYCRTMREITSQYASTPRGVQKQRFLDD